MRVRGDDLRPVYEHVAVLAEPARPASGTTSDSSSWESRSASGWRVTFLGPGTPIVTVAAAAEQLAPNAVVLSSLARARRLAGSPIDAADEVRA